MVEVTQEFLKEHLEYRDGHLWWIKPRAKSVNVGQQFGHTTKKGYRRGIFFGNQVYEHNLIWFYHYGVWPTSRLDHRDTVRDNNDINNLREATHQENSFNRNSHKKSTSKYKGVYWCKRDKKWISTYTYNGKLNTVGRFDCEVLAAKAYDNAVKDLHKEYRRLNFG